MGRGDDGAGPLVAESAKRWSSDRFKVMNVEEALGRLLPDAIDLRPSHIIVVDAALVGGPPGTVKLMRMEDVESVRFSSTHDLPVKVAVGLLASQTGAEAILIGIQPETTKLRGEISESVRTACARLSESLVGSLRSAGVVT